jgi:hypothetical protein
MLRIMDATAPTEPGFAPARVSAPRDVYIDRLRALMTALVVLHHTAITYGAPGGWYYNELKPSSSPSGLLLTLFVATNQAYFMGFFFLLAGYFTPTSLERKGYARFIGDRFLRLGLPLAGYILILNPLTLALITAYRGKGFWSIFFYFWTHAVIGVGPMWFVQALLMFTLAYCVWRSIAGPPLTAAKRAPKPAPQGRWWLLSALAVAAGTLVIRQWIPTGVNVFNLQLGYFAAYIFLFVIGIAAWRYDWLRQLSWKQARPWIIGLALSWPALPIGIAIALRTIGADKVNFGDGHSWPALLYDLWEPFVAWGLITGWLLFMRHYGNAPSALWSWLNRRAYAVYIIHPPVLVGIALLLHTWAAPALVKFASTGAAAMAACWLLADPLVRLPGLRRIV